MRLSLPFQVPDRWGSYFSSTSHNIVSNWGELNFLQPFQTTGDVNHDVHRQHWRNAWPLHGILLCQSSGDLFLCFSNADQQDTKQEMNKICMPYYLSVFSVLIWNISVWIIGAWWHQIYYKFSTVFPFECCVILLIYFAVKQRRYFLGIPWKICSDGKTF